MSNNPGTPQHRSQTSTSSGSPASTLDSETPLQPPRSHESSRGLSLRNSIFSGSSSSVSPGTPISRKPVIRSDPSIITSFDPADKELYDLWAPKS
ncbi:hypothetical protein E1B28_004297 [Marasmius oreades]|uniref:Uncharacterized protein n=1 Tax=Marasmius oreades TaxID=181124 RepID=A0A9P7UY89_9AGAR|nr:uncharacterized protein E1B28_004297 [Marasmius oreades]KAG7096891.1 hypothetical protein E1B28_004297 [Marasmius oreades]